MAFTEFKYCPKCEAQCDHIDGKCWFCLQREEDQRIAAWNALTTEDKLENLRRRVEVLKAGPRTYS